MKIQIYIHINILKFRIINSVSKVPKKNNNKKATTHILNVFFPEVWYSVFYIFTPLCLFQDHVSIINMRNLYNEKNTVKLNKIDICIHIYFPKLH